ncbi:MAG: serine O-acetyltransferase [Candidatus Methanomethylophilaceae archaeon]|nr:serine O-acetyltransferase [Candidatus Methanomethylophilaceae archaeon]MDI3541910.1 serine O-acetyltransferase [Candidatus Methanomethylophilaceae archaeon]
MITMTRDVNEDLKAVMDRDPAVRDEIDAKWFSQGYHAIRIYRRSHELWTKGKYRRARFLNYLGHILTGADIHPGAIIGKGVFIDHAVGVVIGETTIIGDNVCIYQGVTLGGVSSEKGKRHPTIEDNVVIGADATILGNITIGHNTRIGAGSVVLKDVPPNSTVVGVPGKVIKREGIRVDDVLRHDDLPDPVKDTLQDFAEKIEKLWKRMEELESELGSEKQR